MAAQGPTTGDGLERFSPLVGETFRASVAPEEPPVATLVLAQAERGPNAGPDGRPFSLTFESVDGSDIDQGTYWLVREGEAAEPLFLVPIAPGQCQAVFN